MLKKTTVGWLLPALVVGLVFGVGRAKAELANCSPGVDNFVLFVDQSGSMYEQHSEAKEVKELLAKRLLGQMNEQIPEIGYKGALYLFAPSATTLPVAPYSRATMRTAIASIPDDQPVACCTTPMGQGLQDLNGAVNGLSGKTSVIMFSDGEQNAGPDPIAVAEQMVSSRPDLCIHMVSFADAAYGAWMNAQIFLVNKVGRGCRFAEAPVLLNNPAALEKFTRDVFCGPARAKQKIVLRGVNFDFDKATIRPEGKPVLDEAIRTLDEQPDIRIAVEGHTDSVGSDAYNQRLSERRAHAVVDYLAAGGMARGRMSARGLGESKPVASNETEDGRAQNRRVEFGIISE